MRWNSDAGWADNHMYPCFVSELNFNAECFLEIVVCLSCLVREVELQLVMTGNSTC